ncbi:hypothetical protein V5F32_08310 [Xanthobacter oligotrophicus]|uniref:Uncharacterized protein n=1 Tax=Xanthobacter oligotrophicus TaxID=2607286 RepID=A0ABW6ZTV4_9HYPH
MQFANARPDPMVGEGLLPSHLHKPRLTRAEAAQYLSLVHGITIAATTLAKLACTGGGPGFQKSGRTPLYPTQELNDWALARLGGVVRSTSEVNEPGVKIKGGV